MATVKRVAATSDEARAQANARETIKTNNAKSGGAAKSSAKAAHLENSAIRDFRNRPVAPKVKIDSNPVPGKTRIGKLAGGGLGGMFGIKNR